MLTGIIRTIALAAAGALFVIQPAGARQNPPDQQKPPVFRGGTALVPVDVRVLDRDGKAITDLKPEDFIVLENGVAQKISHFGTHAFTPGEPTPNSRPTPRAGGAQVVGPENHRVFLVVLGRGRLQEPSKAMDALLDFFRDRLLPQDYVAVMAWNRATVFSQDHSVATTFMRRFREQHYEVEMLLRNQFGGLGALYGSRHLNPTIQKKVDAVFDLPGARTAIPASDIPGAARAAERTQQAAVDLMTGQARAARVAAGGSDVDVIGSAMYATAPLSFDDFVAESRQTMQDVDNIYTGIEYLRHIEGEKHLIFVTEQGINMPSADDDRSLTAVATDARVAIHTIQTGGVDSRLAQVTTSSATVTHLSMGLSALRTLAERTGGLVSVSNSGATAINRILEATAFGYQLAYTPTNTLLNNRYRKIEVQVKRPGARVLHRQGYFARVDAPYDRRQYLSYTRILAAARWGPDINDIKVDFKASDRNEDGRRGAFIEATVDASRIRTTRAPDGRHVVALNVGIFCVARRGDNAGELWQPIDLRLTDETYATMLKNGLTFNVLVPVRMPPDQVKLIIYDYAGDLLGSKQRLMR
jgi:VWFA-related protein